MANSAPNRPRVLYVEDDKHLRYPISELLKIMGFEVDTAENGKIGVEKAERWQPHFILMDLRMPVMNGQEAIRVIRNNPNTKNIPIYVLSAYTDTNTRASAIEAGANGFIAKPPDIEKINTVIRQTLGVE